MNKLWSLFKVDFNNSFRLSGLKKALKDSKDRWRVIIIGLAFIGFIPLYFLLVKNLYYSYDLIKEANQISYFMQTGIILIQFMMLILGIPYVLNKYYFSQDIEQLIPLPIKSSQIIGSKFITLMIEEYTLSIPLILPFIVIHGIKSSVGIGYIINSIIVILTLPIIPLSILSILIMLLMRFTNIGEKKNTLRLLGSIGFIVFFIFFQTKIQSFTMNSMGNESEVLFNIFKNSNYLVEQSGKIFPPFKWATLFLVGAGFIEKMTNGLLYILSCILAYTIMLKVSESIFFDGLIGGKEVSTKKSKKMEEIDMNKEFKQGKPWIAITKRELKDIFKTPIYLMNTVMGIILVPIMMIIPFLANDGLRNGQGLSELIGEISKLLEEFMPVIKPYILIGMIGFIIVLNFMNTTSSTSFSRDGKAFWIQRTLPIKAEDQIKGRLGTGIIIHLFSVLLIVLLGIFIFKLNIFELLFVSIFGIIGSIPIMELCLIIDLSRPKLDWNSPQEAMKQNTNTLIGMGVTLLYIGLIGFISFQVAKRLDIIFLYIILGIISIINSIVFYKILVNMMRKKSLN